MRRRKGIADLNAKVSAGSEKKEICIRSAYYRADLDILILQLDKGRCLLPRESISELAGAIQEWISGVSVTGGSSALRWSNPDLIFVVPQQFLIVSSNLYDSADAGSQIEARNVAHENRIIPFPPEYAHKEDLEYSRDDDFESGHIVRFSGTSSSKQNWNGKWRAYCSNSRMCGRSAARPTPEEAAQLAVTEVIEWLSNDLRRRARLAPKDGLDIGI